MSYDLTTNVGKVRLIIGDNLAVEVFTDAEITYFLTTNSSNINLAAADVLEAWATKYATSPDSEKIGDYAYTQKIIANMKNLAANLREQDSSVPYFTWAEMDLASIGETPVEEA